MSGAVQQNRVELAKVILQNIFTDSLARNDIPVQTIYRVGRLHGLVRAEMKEARRQLGIESVKVDGLQFWVCSDELKTAWTEKRDATE